MRKLIFVVDENLYKYYSIFDKDIICGFTDSKTAIRYIQKCPNIDQFAMFCMGNGSLEFCEEIFKEGTILGKKTPVIITTTKEEMPIISGCLFKNKCVYTFYDMENIAGAAGLYSSQEFMESIIEERVGI